MKKIKVLTIEKLSEKTLAELRELCIKYGITGMSKKRKDDVIDAILMFYDEKIVEEPPEEYKQESQATSEGPIVALNANVASYRNVNPSTPDDSYVTNISVSCGASSGNFPVVGKKVGEVSEYLVDILNIDRLSVGVVNGENVEDSYVLKSGDTLEFLKSGGRKGL